jgi:hypothetical protein
MVHEPDAGKPAYEERRAEHQLAEVLDQDVVRSRARLAARPTRHSGVVLEAVSSQANEADAAAHLLRRSSGKAGAEHRRLDAMRRGEPRERFLEMHLDSPGERVGEIALVQHQHPHAAHDDRLRDGPACGAP